VKNWTFYTKKVFSISFANKGWYKDFIDK
jgi:hypothetical protein